VVNPTSSALSTSGIPGTVVDGSNVDGILVHAEYHLSTRGVDDKIHLQFIAGHRCPADHFWVQSMALQQFLDFRRGPAGILKIMTDHIVLQGFHSVVVLDYGMQFVFQFFNNPVHLGQQCAVDVPDRDDSAQFPVLIEHRESSESIFVEVVDGERKEAYRLPELSDCGS
jgi:hypothetical protein